MSMKMFEHGLGLSPQHHSAMEPVHLSMRVPFEYSTGFPVPFVGVQTQCQCQPGTTQPKILQSILNNHFASQAETARTSNVLSGRNSTCSSPRSTCSSPYGSHCSSPVGSMHNSSHHCPSPVGSHLSGASTCPSSMGSSRLQTQSSSLPCPSPANSYNSDSSHSQCSSPSGSVEGRGFCPSPMTTQPCVYESKLFSILSLPRTESRQRSTESNTPPTHNNQSLKRQVSEPTEQPMDLSCKRQKVAQPQETESSSSRSILESILCGKRQSPVTHGNQSATVGPTMPDNPNQCVTLAKKNMLPVSARVSDWLVKIVHFARSLPEFTSLSHNEQVTLLLNSWARLLILHMAETNFEFAIAPVFSSPREGRNGQTKLETVSEEMPTQRSVEKVEAFISKCQHLALDREEYVYMRMAALFNPSCPLLDNPAYVDNVNMYVRQSLQDFISRTLPQDKKRYSQLLMSLPNLFSINTHMVENLFCKHVSGGTDVNVLLKELLKQGV